MKFSPAFHILLCLTIACSSNEIGNSKDVNPQTIFVRYSVFGEENNDSVTCWAQFRFAGEDGTTLVLNEPSNIRLDGMEIVVDSSAGMGALYKKKFKTALFAGSHAWRYTDGEMNSYPSAFAFTPFSLKSPLPSAVSREDSLLIELNGLPNGAFITTALSDTSSSTNDVILKNMIDDGRFTIPSTVWQKLGPGPVAIQISNTVDTTLPIGERPAEGGRILVTYALQERTVDLRDDSARFASE